MQAARRHSIFLLFVILNVFMLQAQAVRPGFWERVDVGGTFGLNFGTNYFALNLAPSAVYNFNRYVAAGPSVNYSFIKNGNLNSSVAGGGFIALVNPLESLQVSAEFEELYVVQKLELAEGTARRRFWNTALFLGMGYRTGSVTAGLRYNLLYQEDNLIYTSALLPFIRFYF